jgi:riboflavin synthase
MFTGIVEETGVVESFAKSADSWRLRVSARRLPEGGIHPGESIAINGCCLTAVACDRSGMAFDVLEETRRLTNLHSIMPGSLVNLEGSMRADGRIGGHFVTGHIDGRGVIEVLEARGLDHYLRVRGPEGCGRLIVMKGSIAVDGISLTVAEVEGDSFAVWIIPHTLAVTNLRARRVGDLVNLEFDMLGKYVEKILQVRNGPAI